MRIPKKDMVSKNTQLIFPAKEFKGNGHLFSVHFHPKEIILSSLKY